MLRLLDLNRAATVLDFSTDLKPGLRSLKSGEPVWPESRKCSLNVADGGRAQQTRGDRRRRSL